MVRRVVEAVATCPDRRDLQRGFPELEAEDIREALAVRILTLPPHSGVGRVTPCAP